MQLLFPFTLAALTLTLCNSSTMSQFLEIVLQITIKLINLQPVVPSFVFRTALFECHYQTRKVILLELCVFKSRVG